MLLKHIKELSMKNEDIEVLIVEKKLSGLKLDGINYISIEVNKKLHIINVTEPSFKDESGFYESKGFNYHTSSVELSDGNNRRDIIKGTGFGTLGGHVHYISPSELIKWLDKLEHIWTTDEIALGSRKL